MILREGRIYTAPITADRIEGKQVLFGDNKFIGKVVKYHPVFGATLQVGTLSPIEGVSLGSMREIVIASKKGERINDLQPNSFGITIRPLKLDQWNTALDNLELTGDEVQYGWWKESESSPDTYFQLAWGGKMTHREIEILTVIELARQKDANGEYMYRTEEEILEEINNRNKKKKS